MLMVITEIRRSSIFLLLISLVVFALMPGRAVAQTECDPSAFWIDNVQNNYDANTDTTQFIWTVCWNGSPPALGHFGIGVCTDINQNLVVSHKPQNAYILVGADPSIQSSPYIIKWDGQDLLSIPNDCEDFEVVLSGDLSAPVNTTAYVKAATTACEYATQGPACPTVPLASSSPSASASASTSSTASPSSSPNASASPSASFQPSASPIASSSPNASSTSSPSSSPVASALPSASIEPSASPTATSIPSVDITPSASPSTSASASPSASLPTSASPSASPSTAPSGLCDVGGAYMIPCNADRVVLDGSASVVKGQAISYDWSTDCEKGIISDPLSASPILSFPEFDSTSGPCKVSLAITSQNFFDTCSSAVEFSQCSNCEDISLAASQFAIDQNFKAQSRLVRKLGRRLMRQSIGNTRVRIFITKLIQEAEADNLLAWTKTWSIPSQVLSCINPVGCTSVTTAEYTSDLEGISNKILDLTKQVSKRGRKITGRRNFGAAVVRRAVQLHTGNLELFKTVPASISNCPGLS